MATIRFNIYQRLRAMHCRPAMAYRLAYLGEDRMLTETQLLLTAQREAI